jgi:hypothetical protein
MTRRHALKLGTGAARSAAATPLLSTPEEKAISDMKVNPSGQPSDITPYSSHEICFLRAVDILDALRTKKLSARELMTTYGSPLHKNYVPDFDCRVVQREKQAGAIMVGETNVPEFGRT